MPAAINLKTTLLAFPLPQSQSLCFHLLIGAKNDCKRKSKEGETVKWGGESRGVKELLPLKQRAFLFGDTKRGLFISPEHSISAILKKSLSISRPHYLVF